MVFSSVPLYLDPPNWQQQNPNQQGGVNNENHHLPPLPPPPPPPHACGGGVGSSRPGSMANQARLAKISQPEAALKCPRCDSTNTKFCYFNNYSLSQPRHFCKTCRRYWTKGGTLRNVPVGGGCRRNKKSNKNQNNSSKSPVSSSTERQIMGSNSTTTSSVPSDIIMSQLNPQTNHQLPFMASLHNLTAQFGVGNIGLTTDHHMGFHNNSLLSGGGMQHTFFDPPSAGLFPFQTEQPSVGAGGGEGQLGNSSSRVSQLAPVKMEDNNHGLKSFFGISENNNSNNNNQFWSGNTWTDLSGLNSSSSTHLL